MSSTTKSKKLLSALSVRELWPLGAPGMPLPGPDFIAAAEAAGGEIEIEGKGRNRTIKRASEELQKLYVKALYERNFHLALTLRPGKQKEMLLVPGHRWGTPPEGRFGPRPSDVMVIGKMAGRKETEKSRNMAGPAGELLMDTLVRLGVKGAGRWYVTNLIKCEHPEAGKTSTLKAGWISEFLPLLHQELRIVQPKYILCLGADAVKALLGKGHSVSSMDGRAVEFKYPVSKTSDGEVEYKTASVMCCVNPAYVLAAPEAQEQLDFALARWGQLVQGLRFDAAEPDIDHRYIDNLEDLEALAYEINNSPESYESPGVQVIAVDGEWHGEHPQNAGAYLRSIQISWADKRAAYIAITDPGGENAFNPHWKQAIKVLRRICKTDENREVRAVGQFLNADLEWLVHYKLDLRAEFRAASKWRDTRWHGGFDTGLAAHAIEETGDYKLESMAMRHTTCPPYNLLLQKWKEDYCKKHKLKAKDLEGYGMCPTEVLWPYGAYDADVTRRLYVAFQPLLDSDRFGNSCRKAFWTSMRAAPAVLEIHQTGLEVDRDRVDSLTLAYMTSRSGLEAELREKAAWPEFNMNSPQQVREYLFGEKYNKKFNKLKPNEVVKLRPDGAKSLYLDPLFDTSKQPVPWADIAANGKEDDHTAGTDKKILSILAQESQEVVRVVDGERVTLDYSPEVSLIRDYRFISQVLKSVLKPPKLEKDADGGDQWVLDADGRWVYAGGLASCVCDDNRVRTHIYQTKETGRWSSARPPLQNLSKQREKDYKRILAGNYQYALRSMLRAPEGYVLIEADYIGAELYGMAMMAGDEEMIEHCRRNQLPEDHPDYYDIHSHIAVMSFGLKCDPSKLGLALAGLENLRIVAKSVIFGIAYGRGAKAIALAAKEQGVKISVGDAQKIIDTIFAMYPKLEAFFADCKYRASEERWMVNPFGRYRRVPLTTDRKIIADLERQLMNFPIQSLIADAVNRACDHLWEYRRRHPDLLFKFALQIHDALLLLVPKNQVPQTIASMRRCMGDRVPIYPADLNGKRLGTGPYHLGIDTEVFVHWGEKLKPQQCLDLGFSPEYAHWENHEGVWGRWVEDDGEKTFKAC